MEDFTGLGEERPSLGYNNTRRSARGEVASALETNVMSYIFPGDLNSLDHWMCFRVNKPELMRAKDFPVSSDMARIFLPMPPALATSYNQGYNAESIGVLGMGGSKIGAKAREGGFSAVVDSAKDKAADVLENPGKAAKDALSAAANIAGGGGASGGAVMGAMMGRITGGIMGAIGGAAAKGAMAGAGVARNPYMALVYQNPQFREHTFSWKFVSKNFKDSRNLLYIIQVLKYYSHPSRTGEGEGAGLSHFYNYPEQFDIDFHHDEMLFNIGPSVLKGMQVNYHPDGPLYHTSENSELNLGNDIKAPVAIQLQLTFQEVAIITKAELNAEKR
jgi:hypothetical protein